MRCVSRPSRTSCSDIGAQWGETESTYKELVRAREVALVGARDRIESLKRSIGELKVQRALADLTELAAGMHGSIGVSDGTLERIQERVDEKRDFAKGRVRVARDAFDTEDVRVREAEQAAIAEAALRRYESAGQTPAAPKQGPTEQSRRSDHGTDATQTNTNTKIPLALKLVFTAFMLVLVPFYWQAYGPTNFLYFCDVSLFLTLVALWTESPLLASIPAVGIVVPQLLWVLDFGTGLFGLHSDRHDRVHVPREHPAVRARPVAVPRLAAVPLAVHGAPPRLRPARLAAWTAIGWALMLVCYFYMPAPPAPADTPNLPVNINYVFGPSDSAMQTWMAPPLYLLLMLVALPALLWAPAHFALARFMKPAGGALTAAQPRIA